jgi:hypothetical protein
LRVEPRSRGLFGLAVLVVSKKHQGSRLREIPRLRQSRPAAGLGEVRNQTRFRSRRASLGSTVRARPFGHRADK